MLRNYRIELLSALVGVFSITLTAQVGEGQCPRLSADGKGSLKEYITYLASDELRGRYPGTDGERMAAEYIAQKFSDAGFRPGAEEGYFQLFTIFDGVSYGDENAFKRGKESLPLEEEGYYPTAYSANASFEGKTVDVQFGIVLPEKDRDDLEGKKLKGKAAVMDISSPDGIHPHSAYMSQHDIGLRVSQLVDAGAAAVILIDPSSSGAPRMNFKRLDASRVPVIFVADETQYDALRKGTKVSLSVDVEEKVLEARNVIGFLDNNAEQTVVIGAHYDHLGMGGEGSRYRGEPAIHNGADDNASGVAGLIALARTLSKNREANSLSKRNYIFIAFSGEEKGLLGSNFYVKSELFDAERTDYMINLDMIGHLDDDEALVVNGVGTSPIFKEIARETRCVEVRVETTPGGIGPSDHTSFYNMEVPALHFFTGAHDHYHRPSDDEEIIRYAGLERVLNYVLYLMDACNAEQKLKFTKTEEANSRKAPRFSVTLGVVPDYAYTGKGMRIDGVSEGKPASKAGLKAGDVVIALGDHKVGDMMSYMKALGAFKKGDAAEVFYVRDGETMSAEVQF